MEDRWQRLRELYAEIDDLQNAAAVLSWDQQTYMPPGGAQARAEQLATLRRLVHERATSPELGKLLEELASEAGRLPYDSLEASLHRVGRRNYERAVRVPPKLVAEITVASSQGYHAWLKAREERSFGPFAAPLKRLVDLQLEVADALGYEETRYDALLDLREPGVRTRDVAALFAQLKAELVPLVAAIVDRGAPLDDSFLYQPFDEQKQWDFGIEVLERIGFDFKRGRQDRSAHPFCTSFSPDDVRLTTRMRPDDLGYALFSSIHEAGHGMYEQNVPAEFRRTPLGGGASGGFHESQSRLWENVVGRSRGFWEYFLPRLKEVFPQLEPVSLDAFYRAVNCSRPSLIRTEADEVTYNLHIMVRFEIEQEILKGQLPVDDLPAAWDAKMEEYLGIRPANVVEGVLQDIHWSGAGLASFPAYTLGNVISLQLYERALADHPEIPEQIRKGEFGTLGEWMRQNLHVHGSKFTPAELVQRITGGGLDAGPYLRYIREKYTEIYRL